MGKCSCTWYEWTCPEPTWRGSEEYCIFHDPFPEKDIELFRQRIREKLNKKDYVFTGYCFPEDMNFNDWRFEEDADFGRATFQGYANFSGATFQNANFREVTFQKNAYFSYAIFQDAYFVGATFQDANFSGAVIEKTFDFTPKSNKKN